MPLIELKSRFLIPRSHESSGVSNVLAKELQSFLRPLNIIQLITFCPKYFVRNNIISRNGPKAITYCILGNIIIILIWLMRIITMPTKTGKLVKYSVYVRIFSIISRINFSIACLGFFINLFCNIIQCYNNVKLVLMLQKALNVIKIDRKVFGNLIFWNWIYLISLCFWHFVLYFGVTAIVRGFCFLDFMSDLPVLSFDVNVLYAIRIAVLIRYMMTAWNKIIRNKLFSVEDSMFCKQMYETFFYMKCTCVLYNKVFQDMILYYVVVAFFHSLLSIKNWIALVVTAFDIDDPLLPNEKMLSLLLTSTAKRVLIITILSIEVEKLLSVLQKAHIDLTMLLVNKLYTHYTKRFCKNALRLDTIMSSRMCLRGLFYVDSSLPIKVVALITTYVTLLLQFALLN